MIIVFLFSSDTCTLSFIFYSSFLRSRLCLYLALICCWISSVVTSTHPTVMTLANLGISSLISKLSSEINDKLNPSLAKPLNSECLTPPGGNVTPFPNPVDNRLPGISHSSFGQVRPTFCHRPKSTVPVVGQQDRSSPLSRQSLLSSGQVGGGNGGPGINSARSVTSSDSSSTRSQVASRDGRRDDYFDAPPLLPHEHFHPAGCLTPPTSPSAASSPSASSVNVLAGKVSDTEAPAPSLQAAKSKATAPIGERRGQATTKDEKNAPKGSQRGVLGRRHTYASNVQLSGILTTTTIATAQLSNPAISNLTSAPRPRAGSQSAHELRRLTDGGRGRNADQNTPPYSPRTQSRSETVATAVKSSDPSTSTSAPTSNAAQRSGADTSGPLPPKGKLSVLISEGRGLRASVDPYVVCQFQRSEYISKGPINAVGAEPNKRKLAGGAFIGRADSDPRRPVAIPMKSRQSSNTSAGDAREAKVDEAGKVTNPKWEHQATL